MTNLKKAIYIIATVIVILAIYTFYICSHHKFSLIYQPLLIFNGSDCTIKRIFVDSSKKNIALLVKMNNSGFKIISNNEIGNNYDKIFDNSFIFSPNGKRYAYIAVRNGKFLLVENRNIIGEHSDPISHENLILS